MSPAALLVELDRQGFTLAVEGDGIRVTPASRLTVELRDRIRRHKPDLLLLLSPEVKAPAEPDTSPADLPSEWQELWGERAAIMEYDGGLPRERAEAEALKDVLERMRRAVPP
jgi:TubC N-terminal docking domain